MYLEEHYPSSTKPCNMPSSQREEISLPPLLRHCTPTQKGSWVVVGLFQGQKGLGFEMFREVY